MLTMDDIQNMCDSMTYVNAQSIIRMHMMRGINVDESEYPNIRLRASTYNLYYNYEFLDLTFNDETKQIVELNSKGTKPHRRLTETDIALLINFTDAREKGTLELECDFGRRTSGALRKFLNEKRTQNGVVVDKGANVHLYVYRLQTEGHRLGVEFRIGRVDSTSYVVKNITTLIRAVEDHTPIRFGKNLEFVPSQQSFDLPSRKIIAFLSSLIGKMGERVYDSYSSYNSSYISRELMLDGAYVKEFFEALNELPLYCKVDDIQLPFKLTSDAYDIPFYVKRDGDGFVIDMDKLDYVMGLDRVYFFNKDTYTIHMQEKTEALQMTLDLYTAMRGKQQYVTMEDIKPFTKAVIPVIEPAVQLYKSGYNPEDYLPIKPKFEVRLDLPQEDMISCELTSIYPDKKYNVLEGYTEDVLLRNIEDEKRMDEFITPWFNSFDNQNHRLVLINDEDKIYNFLTAGIPQLQMMCDVYISESLKKLTVTRMQKVSFGVSVDHDLLQLHLSADQRTLDDLSEILSRYTPKKKYYRLKNGSFINVNDEEIDAIARLSNDLQLTSKQIKSGETSVPKYRALYLDDTAEDDVLPIQRDKYFRDLVHNVHSIENKKYEVPMEVKDVLRDYQVQGFQWLKALGENGFGGLLADEMGLGKSVQIISLILSMKPRERVLIVCPASLVYNWRSEFKKFAPEVEVVMLVGSGNARKYQIENSAKDAILITSYDALKRDVDHYDSFTFDLEVIDEAQYIKNASTQAAESVKQIHAKYRVALTGTPIENRLSELWSIFDYLMPGFLYSYTRFKRNYENPIVKEKDEASLAHLRKMIAPFILRREKKDVLKDLPDKLEEVMYAPLEGEQKELYDARRQRLKISLGSQSSQDFNRNRIQVLAELTRLRQICCNPGLVYEGYKGNSAKEDMCIELIKRAVEEGHKILVFSQFTTMLDQLTRRLDDEKITYHMLEGSTPKLERARLVDAFQVDDVPVFCISLKAGGTGLNLTAADIVIHYDPWWNTAAENQAADRAHRIGQEKIVTVYRLIVEDTVEERILELQKSKADLAGEILSGDEMSSSSLTKEQLMEIL